MLSAQCRNRIIDKNMCCLRERRTIEYAFPEISLGGKEPTRVPECLKFYFYGSQLCYWRKAYLVYSTDNLSSKTSLDHCTWYCNTINVHGGTPGGILFVVGLRYKLFIPLL